MNRTIRDAMIAYRRRLGMSRLEMAMFARCSEKIIEGIEVFGWVTHPRIAARIARVYNLGVHGYNELVPEEHRAEKLPTVSEPPGDEDWKLFARSNQLPYATFWKALE